MSAFKSWLAFVSHFSLVERVESFANQSPREVETRITLDTHLKNTISTEARGQLR